MRLLFVKDSLTWPRVSGHDVHSYHMLRALGELGHEVYLTTRCPPLAAAVEGLDLQGTRSWKATGTSIPALTRWQEKFRSYWGVETNFMQAVAEQADQLDVDAVVAVGLEVLPLLAGVKGATRIWYAADEWVWHHLSVVRVTQPGTWNHVLEAVVKGLYEYTFRNVVDRAWVVSDADRRAMRWIAGIKQVDVIPNGVDADHFSPRQMPEIPHSCVFWGRLDFEPNIQALQWFCRTVWPQIVARVPAAVFKIIGFAPVPEVKQLAEQPGVTLLENLPDLRDEIARCQVVVLPMQSGGGIKNKLLEAAAMARPILCSPRACNGLNLGGSKALQVASSPQQWVDGLLSLWKPAADRRTLGLAAREWVIAAHCWRTTAQSAVQPLQARSSGQHETVAMSDASAHAYAE
jgi:glycosyltransferase involved in cell wall biosynthesis